MNDPNRHLSPKSKYLNREMTAWDYDVLEELFDGDENFALYLEEADHEAVFFHAHGRFWLFNHLPTTEVRKAAPEVIIDRIGATAEKEYGAEPVLMHRDELPTHVQATVEDVEENPPEHPHDEVAEAARHRNPPEYYGIEEPPRQDDVPEAAQEKQQR